MKVYKQINAHVNNVADALNELVNKGWNIEYVISGLSAGFLLVTIVYSSEE